MATAIINGIKVTGTPKEIAELIRLTETKITRSSTITSEWTPKYMSDGTPSNFITKGV